MTDKLFTIGYASFSIKDFVITLQQHKINALNKKKMTIDNLRFTIYEVKKKIVVLSYPFLRHSSFVIRQSSLSVNLLLPFVIRNLKLVIVLKRFMIGCVRRLLLIVSKYSVGLF